MATRKVVRTDTYVKIVHSCGHKGECQERFADEQEKTPCYRCYENIKNKRIEEAQTKYELWLESLTDDERQGERDRDFEVHRYDGMN